MALKVTRSILLASIVVLTGATLAPVLVAAQTYSVSFMVAGLPPGLGTRYYVDYMLNGTIQTGDTKRLNFTQGRTHTLSVDLNVGEGNGTKYQCRDNLWSFADAGTHTFTYKTQYYLQVVSAYGSPSGTDWYDKGATAYARLATNVTAGPEGVRYVLVRWEGDASGQAIVSEPMIMDRAKKAVAAWKTQYTLRISYDPIGMFPPSTLWLDAGSVADFSAPEGTTGTDTRHVFAQWVGDHTGASVRGSLLMDGPKSVTAKYKTQHLLSLLFTPPEVARTLAMENRTWYDAGQTARLGPVPQLIPISSAEQLALISWNVDGLTQQGTSIDVPMNGPHRVELIYRTQYYLQVTSRLGQTTGSGWYFSGEKARFSIIYGGSEFPIKYTLASWQSNPSTKITVVSATEAEVNMDRAYVIEAVWNADYTPVWIFIFGIGSAAMLIGGLAVVAVKKPGSLGRLASSLGRSFRRRKLRPPGMAPTLSTFPVVCQRCGARIASAAAYCQSCGALRPTERVKAAPDLKALDDRVYDYIVERHGEISLSRASKDLGLSVDELKSSTERLKKKGRLA